MPGFHAQAFQFGKQSKINVVHVHTHTQRSLSFPKEIGCFFKNPNLFRLKQSWHIESFLCWWLMQTSEFADYRQVGLFTSRRSRMRTSHSYPLYTASVQMINVNFCISIIMFPFAELKWLPHCDCVLLLHGEQFYWMQPFVITLGYYCTVFWETS